MRKFTAPALTALLLVFAPQSLQAQTKPANPPRDEMQTRHEPSERPEKSQPGPGTSSKGQFGDWKSAWGKAPPAPPKHWAKKNDWHRHVRACQQRYKSYSARTDTYRTHSGKQLRCKL